MDSKVLGSTKPDFEEVVVACCAVPLRPGSSVLVLKRNPEPARCYRQEVGKDDGGEPVKSALVISSSGRLDVASGPEGDNLIVRFDLSSVEPGGEAGFWLQVSVAFDLITLKASYSDEEQTLVFCRLIPSTTPGPDVVSLLSGLLHSFPGILQVQLGREVLTEWNSGSGPEGGTEAPGTEQVQVQEQEQVQKQVQEQLQEEQRSGTRDGSPPAGGPESLPLEDEHLVMGQQSGTLDGSQPACSPPSPQESLLMDLFNCSHHPRFKVIKVAVGQVITGKGFLTDPTVLEMVKKVLDEDRARIDSYKAIIRRTDLFRRNAVAR